MIIKYVVVQIETTGRGVNEIKRIEFDDVNEAIEKHKEVVYSPVYGTYWDIVVEYEND